MVKECVPLAAQKVFEAEDLGRGSEAKESKMQERRSRGAVEQKEREWALPGRLGGW